MTYTISVTFYGCTFTAIILAICNVWSLLADKKCHKWLCCLNIVIAIIGYGAGTMLKIKDTNWYNNLYSVCAKISFILAISNATVLLTAVIKDMLHNQRFANSTNKTLKTAKKAVKWLLNILGNVLKMLGKLMKKVWQIFVILSILNPIGIIGKIVLINKISKTIKKWI